MKRLSPDWLRGYSRRGSRMVALLLAAGLLIGCGSHHEPILGGVVFFRMVYAWTGAVNDTGTLIERTQVSGTLSGQVPLEVGATPTWQTGPPFPPSWVKSEITRREIDFGDGAGFIDVTQYAAGWDFILQDGLDPAGAVLHTYTVPGDYVIRVRITYWDGEVVYNGPRETVTVRALAAGAVQ